MVKPLNSFSLILVLILIKVEHHLPNCVYLLLLKCLFQSGPGFLKDTELRTLNSGLLEDGCENTARCFQLMLHPKCPASTTNYALFILEVVLN